MASPSFLVSHRDSVYAVHELDDYQGQKCAAVSLSELNADRSTLKMIQCIPCVGQWACHISLNMERRCAYIASYLSPYFSVKEIKPNGLLGEDLFTRCYKDVHGSGVVPDRQEASHPHSAYNWGDFIYVLDLGCDRIWGYRHTAGEGVIAMEPEFTPTPPGSGPRHMAFHPTLDLAFLLTELSNRVIVYSVNKTDGSLTELNSYGYLSRETMDGNDTGAEIKVHPGGEFVYLSNRVSNHGKGCLVCYKIIKETRELVKVESVSTQGTWPRNFNINPSGNVLLCADQHLDLIEVLRIERESGRLTKIESVPCRNKPACIVFKDA